MSASIAAHTPSHPSSAPCSPKNRVKFLCSHGGRILPRHGAADAHLKYIAGETRVISVSRDVSFQGFYVHKHAELMKKLTYLIDGDMVLKYKVISEDLDTLVSVKSDDDLRHMIDEIDLYELAGTQRLRAFLFPVKHGSRVSSSCSSPRSPESCTVDAMNNTISMLKAQSSPSICRSPQYNYQHGDPQRNGDPERLVSLRSMGRANGMKHHVDPASQYHYNGSMHNQRGRCCTGSMHGERRSIEKTWGMSSVPSSPRYF